MHVRALSLALLVTAVFGVCIWVAVRSEHAWLHTELRSGDALVVVISVGAPRQRVNMLLRMDGAAIVVDGNVLGDSESYTGALDYITLGTRETRLLPVRTPTADEFSAMSAARAEGILGLGPQSPIWATARCIRLGAGALVIGDDPCPDDWATIACGPPSMQQPNAWCLLPNVTVGVPGMAHVIDPALASAVLNADEAPAFSLGPFVVRSYEYHMRVHNLRLVRAAIGGEPQGLAQQLVFDYELARDDVTRTLHWRVARVHPHTTIASGLLALALALALYIFLLNDDRLLQPLTPNGASVPLFDAARAAMIAAVVLLVGVIVRLAIHADFWSLPLGGLWAMPVVQLVEAAIGVAVSLNGALTEQPLAHPGHPLAIEVGIWAGVWLALAPHTPGNWLELVSVGVATVLVVVRVRRALLYMLSAWSASDHWVAATYIYGGAIAQLYVYCVFVGVPGIVTVIGLSVDFALVAVIWLAFALVCLCAYYARQDVESLKSVNHT